ncbi:MAG: leucine-rich repeat protein [Clostridia bacterium]|nr:leucine-rich repeat protein [Clostridia bacterium]
MRKLKNLLVVISILICSLICACLIIGCSNKENSGSTPIIYTEILSVDGAEINDNEIFMFVDQSVDSVTLADKVICSSESVWRLYYDKLGQIEIPTKIAAGLSGVLSNGDNFFYIVVTSLNGTQTSLYELTVHRSYAVNINFYNANSLLKSDTVYTGHDYTVNYTPNIDGYNFNYWKSDNGSKFDGNFTVWNNVSLYVDKTAKQYIASLDVNGGNELRTDTQIVTYDSDYGFIVPTKTGYSFIGWYDGNTLITSVNGESLLVWKYTQNKIFTAKWEANTYTLTALSDNSCGGTVAGGGDYQYDSIVTLTATTNIGYTFIGWYDESGDKVSLDLVYSVKMGVDTSYTAKWIQVIPISENIDKGTVSILTDAYKPGDSATVTATTNIGYTFIGWYDEETKLTGELSYTFEMASVNAVYTAKWIQVIPISENINKGTVSILTGTYKPGDSAIVTATTNIGYTFIGWYDEETKLTGELSYTFEMPSVNAVYTAKWITNKEMENFIFVSNVNSCTITGIIDKTISKIIVPDYVTSIGDGAFYGCGSLASIEIPSSVSSIGSDAFRDCGSLANIDIPNSVSSIGDRAFSGCSNLTNIEIPNSVTFLGAQSFYGCGNLTSIELSNSITSIGDGSFYSCNSLVCITLPNSVTSIGGSAFSACLNLASVTMGFNVVSIGEYAFSYCRNLTSIEIPNSVTSIGGGAFYECNSLTAIEIPNSVKSIEDNAFYKCSSLATIEIPNSVKSIGKYAFFSCSSLTSVTIGNGVAIIGGYSFASCSSLTSILIPNSVTSIEARAFQYCKNLASVTFMNTNSWSAEYLTGGSYSFKSSDLANVNTAANYLTSTYSNLEWTRGFY